MDAPSRGRALGHGLGASIDPTRQVNRVDRVSPLQRAILREPRPTKE